LKHHVLDLLRGIGQTKRVTLQMFLVCGNQQFGNQIACFREVNEICSLIVLLGVFGGSRWIKRGAVEDAVNGNMYLAIGAGCSLDFSLAVNSWNCEVP